MFRVVADMFVTYVATRLTHYNLRQHSEASDFIPYEAHEDLDDISEEADISSSAFHPNLHFTI
jgi:hypothetical protein